MNTDQAQILIVDDLETNRALLEGHINALGLRYSMASGGQQALDMVRENPPDLILLDVMMPEMDGFQVLKALKSDEKTMRIPVIMISALDELDIVASCIKLGAEDYLFKPFNTTILHARIQSGLNRKRLSDMEQEHRRYIEEYNDRLREEVAEKTRELREVHERLRQLDAAKGELLSLIARELRAPLNGLLEAADMLINEPLHEDTRAQYEELFHSAAERMDFILEHSRLLAELRDDNHDLSAAPLRLKHVLNSAIEQVEPMTAPRRIEVVAEMSGDELIQGQREFFSKAFRLLLETAAKYARVQSEIVVRALPSGERMNVMIEAEGRNIPADRIDSYFDLNAMIASEQQRNECGLAPALAERILRMFGGRVRIENTPNSGIRLICDLPSEGSIGLPRKEGQSEENLAEMKRSI